MRIKLSILLIFLAILLSGCVSARSTASVSQVNLPTPTLNPLFNLPKINSPGTALTISTPDVSFIQGSTIEPTPVITSTQDTLITSTVSTIPFKGSITATITSTEEVTATQTSRSIQTPQPSQVITDTVYAGTMNPNWTIQASPGVSYEMQNVSHSIEGKPALAITSGRSGNFFFQVRTNANTQYLHNKVLGIAFWLNSGNNTLQPGDLGLTVTGSNKVPYYQYDDQSANSQQLLTRSGTRMYDLGLNHPMLPNSWLFVQVNLDDLVYDPGFQPTPVVDTDYKYVTGFYLITQSKKLQTFYINKVSILLIP